MAYLDRLRAAGVPERMVEAERDSWILVAAQLPERMADYMRVKTAQLDDPEVRDLYLELDEISRWPADDPRLDAVVVRLVAQFAEVPAEDWAEEPMPPELADLLDSVFLSSVPGARRILAGLERHGYVGWTNLRPAELVD